MGLFNSYVKCKKNISVSFVVYLMFSAWRVHFQWYLYQWWKFWYWTMHTNIIDWFHLDFSPPQMGFFKRVRPPQDDSIEKEQLQPQENGDRNTEAWALSLSQCRGIMPRLQECAWFTPMLMRIQYTLHSSFIFISRSAFNHADRPDEWDGCHHLNGTYSSWGGLNNQDALLIRLNPCAHVLL